MRLVMRIVGNLLLVAMLFAHGCAPAQLVSEQSVDNKLAEIKLGVTTKADIEKLFGTEHGREDRDWSYSLSDTALVTSEHWQGSSSGGLPLPAILPTNTRAVITVRFTEGGRVNGLAVERYFNPPFINDYWYLFKGRPDNIVESAMHVGEANNFRVVGSDKSAGKFALEDGSGKARITVGLEQRTLHIKSINPYDLVTNEYRVFTKREGVFIDSLSQEMEQASEAPQGAGMESPASGTSPPSNPLTY